MIKLEYLEEKDFGKLVEWNNNKSPNYLFQWAGPSYKYPLTEEQIKEYFSKGINKENSNSFVYKIILVQTNEIIGTIQLAGIDKNNRSARICRFLIGDENIRGKGIGKQALEEVLNIGFNKFNLHRISLGVFDFNHSAVKCYESAGFVKEGLLRDIRKAEEGYWSLYEMSILEEEWRNKNL